MKGDGHTEVDWPILEIVIPSELDPADADDVCASIRSDLTGPGPIELRFTSDALPSPCAIQLAVAVKRSADAAVRELRLSKNVETQFGMLQF